MPSNTINSISERVKNTESIILVQLKKRQLSSILFLFFITFLPVFFINSSTQNSWLPPLLLFGSYFSVLLTGLNLLTIFFTFVFPHSFLRWGDIQMLHRLEETRTVKFIYILVIPVSLLSVPLSLALIISAACMLSFLAMHLLSKFSLIDYLINFEKNKIDSSTSLSSQWVAANNLFMLKGRVVPFDRKAILEDLIFLEDMPFLSKSEESELQNNINNRIKSLDATDSIGFQSLKTDVYNPLPEFATNYVSLMKSRHVISRTRFFLVNFFQRFEVSFQQALSYFLIIIGLLLLSHFFPGLVPNIDIKV